MESNIPMGLVYILMAIGFISLFLYIILPSRPKPNLKPRVRLQPIDELFIQINTLVYSEVLKSKRVGIGIVSEDATPDDMFDWKLKFKVGDYKIKFTHMIRTQMVEIFYGKENVLGYTITSYGNIYDLFSIMEDEEIHKLAKLIKEMNE